MQHARPKVTAEAAAAGGWGDGCRGRLGGPATAARFAAPVDVALGPDGSLYIADPGDDRVRKVSPSGLITTFAGTGLAGYSGDDGAPELAQLYDPRAVAVGPDGTVYIADSRNRRVRAVYPWGRITTVAGGGTTSPTTAPGKLATEVSLGLPVSVEVAADGTLVIADEGNAYGYFN